jgi:hypothetical protein
MGAVVTGQPIEKNESQSDKDPESPGARAWDARTAALAARLEALLEQHHGQPSAGDRDAAPAGPRRASA